MPKIEIPQSKAFDECIGRLRDRVAMIAREPRIPGAPHHTDIRRAITAELLSLGFDALEYSVKCQGPPCINIIATWPSHNHLNRRRLAVGAHYDSMPNSPGADDNASAIAAMLELARWIAPLLAQDAPRRSIELAFYDREEDGLVGSKAHAQALAKAGASVTMIALEMLGFADNKRGSQAPIPGLLEYELPETADFLAVCADQTAAKWASLVTAAMREPDGLSVIPVIGPKVTRSPWTRLSDHCSFWDAGLPAMVITDTGLLRNRHYHQPSDRPETLDYDFLAKGTRGLHHAIGRLLYD